LRRKWRRKTKKKRARASDDVESDEVSEELADEESVEEAGYEQEDVEKEEYEYAREEQESEEDAYTYSEYDDTTQGSYGDDESHYRIDEAEVATEYSGAFPDPEALKGLSKRERRRLRKQWREQQRQADG